MAGHQQLPQPKRFRRLLCVSLVMVHVSILLFWSYSETHSSPSVSSDQHHSSSAPPPAQGPLGCQPLVPRQAEPSFVAVNGTKTLLISAYTEHRTGRKEVRIIAVVLRREAVKYHCLLQCQGQLQQVRGSSSVHADHFDFEYGTADIMCPLPAACQTASRVAVLSAAAKSEDSMTFLEVKNQRKSDSFAHNFTVCFSVMFEFTNVLQLVQSLEMLRLLGVSRVVVYVSSCSRQTWALLNHYTQTGLVEVIPWSWSRYLNVSRGFIPSQHPGDIHYFGQIPALNDCVYRYMYQSRYVALQDVDELILPQTVDSWSELLPILEKKYGADKGYMFENNVFPITIHKLPPASTAPPLLSPTWHNVTGVNILAHLYQEPIIKETYNWNFKVIVNPRAVFTPTVHGLLKSQKGCAWVDRTIARMYHTRPAKQPNLKAKQLIYDDRLLSFSKRLIPAVNTTLRQSGLIPQQNTDRHAVGPVVEKSIKLWTRVHNWLHIAGTN
ncbi:uncharacterized protein LOC114868716 [Betta splendens]|uniref:Glycosyltransferase family 92 protein n=1 Tax=Betta splendens TaxID=158456 RepID=A0A6P7PEI3_BETSP|nr:uncharacterized protein LOC114868716 [Betta splendens]